MIDEKARAELIRAMRDSAEAKAEHEVARLEYEEAFGAVMDARVACAPALPGDWVWDGSVARLVEPDMSVTEVMPLGEVVMVTRRSSIAAHATPPIVPPEVVAAVREFDKLLRSVS